MARKLKLGEAVALPGVVVGPAADHHLGAVLERALGQLQPLEGVVPDRAADSSLGVAELEVGAGPRLLQVEDLADQQHPRAGAQEVAKAGGPLADLIRARQIGVGGGLVGNDGAGKRALGVEGHLDRVG